jgi:hypothetical protein
MKPFRSLRLATRLGAVFGTVAAGLLILAVVGVSSLKSEYGAVLTVLAAAAVVLVTRSVTRPVQRLRARLHSLNDADLESLAGGLDAAAGGDFTRASSTRARCSSASAPMYRTCTRA